MLPEQVWDYDDMPDKGMFKGRPAGSAQPLVWAHSEYLKLLKSACMGEVFDCVSTVQQRYAADTAKRTVRANIQIFKSDREITSIAAGTTLRIVDQERFRVVYTTDNWVTKHTLESHPIGYAGFFADIPSEAGKSGEIILTIYWPGPDRWLGHNAQVEVVGA